MIVIRNTNNSDDLNTIYNNLYIALVKHHNALNPEYKKFIDENKDIKDIVLSSMKSPHSYVAIDTKTHEFVGLLVGREYENNIFSLDDLYIVPNYRGRNIGKSMVSKFIKSHNKYDIILLVLKENGSVVEFYKKFGFKVVKETQPLKYNISGYLMRREGRR